MPPPQTGKAREIAVRRDQLAPVLDRQGGDVRVGNPRSFDAAAQVDEHIPVATAWRDERRPRPLREMLAERDRGVHRRWGIEDSRVRDNAQEMTTAESPKKGATAGDASGGRRLTTGL
jgi:hypothetical protein